VRLALLSVFIGGHVLPNASVYFNELGWARHPDAGTLPSILLVLTNHHGDYINEAVWSLTWELRVAILFPLLMLPILRWRNMGAAQVYVSLLVLGQAGRHLLRAHPAFAQVFSANGLLAHVFHPPQLGLSEFSRRLMRVRGIVIANLSGSLLQCGTTQRTV
jgi:peptidoglycan/LPS O-acetylase OafA/YrhL